MANCEIRVALMTAGLKHYQLAKALGIHEVTLSRKLRHELPDEAKDKMIAAINNLAKENTKN